MPVEGLHWGEWSSPCFTETFLSKRPFSETAVKCKSSLIPESALLMSRGQEAGLEGDWQKSQDPLLQGLLHRPFPPEISTPQYQLRHFVINKHTWGQLTNMIYVATHAHMVGHIRILQSEMLWWREVQATWGLCIQNADLATVMQKKLQIRIKSPACKSYVLMQNLTLESLPNIKCLFRFTGSLRSVYCILHTKQGLSVEVHFIWQKYPATSHTNNTSCAN